MYTCQRETAWHFYYSITWPNLPCLPKWMCQSVITFFRDETTHLAFQITYDSSDKSIEFSVSHPSSVSWTCLATPFITDTKWIRSSVWKIRNIRRTRNTIFAGTQKPKVRNNFTWQVIRSTYIQSDSHLLVQSARYKYIFYHKSIPQNNGTHVKMIQK